MNEKCFRVGLKERRGSQGFYLCILGLSSITLTKKRVQKENRLIWEYFLFDKYTIYIECLNILERETGRVCHCAWNSFFK